MTWKFWKRDQLSYDLSPSEISERLRGFILDSQIHNGHEIAVILGCAISSEEVMEKEEEESDKRVQRISYLVPLVYAMSHALAEGAMEYQRATFAESAPKEAEGLLSNEIWIESRKLMEQVSMSALLGTISQLVDMGLLSIPKERKRK
jgi:hypothetical protein